MPEADDKITIWDHVEELRTRLMRAVIAVIVLAVGWFLYPEVLFDRIIFWPLFPDFPLHNWGCALSQWLDISSTFCFEGPLLHISNIRFTGQFIQHITLSLLAGVVTAFPYVLWQVWRFIRPGLKSNEARWGRLFLWGGSGLFFLGVLFGYFFLVPVTTQFLSHYTVSTYVTNIITLQSYISTVTALVFATAFVFELPLIVYTLTRMGLVTAGTLRTYRRHAAIIILALSAIITPPDVMSQLVLFLPFFLLYQISIGIARRAEPKEEDDDENDEDPT